MTRRIAAVALAGVCACGAVEPLAPASGSTAAAREAAPAGLEVEPALRALALVNERDPARARSLAERHALLRELASSGDAGLVDVALNHALDLLQAEQSPTPCTTFRNALEGLSARPDPAAVSMVRAAKLPRSLTAGRAPDGDCSGLDALRVELVALLVSEPPVAPTVDVAATRPRARAPARSKTAAAAASEPAASVPQAPASPAAPVAGKLDDDELRPFGK
jgi:hypothetical protein